MVNAKVSSVAFCALACASLMLVSSCCHWYEWEKIPVEGRLTGVTASGTDNIPETMGTVDSMGVFTAPNGKVFSGGAAPVAEALMLDAQPAMADLKQVVGHSAVAMGKGTPEGLLCNWAADIMKVNAEKEFGTPLDLFIINTGGLRSSIPEGEVLKDDIVSMFPFNNYLAYVELKGEEVLGILNFMAETRFQALSGVRVVVEDNKVKSAEINGEPLDVNKLYKVGTIDFMLDGGDGFYLARNASKMIISEKKLMDAALEFVRAKEAEGIKLESAIDGRIQVLDGKMGKVW